MEAERIVDFDQLMRMKEKRRVSRAKGKRTYIKGKMNNKTNKPRKMKNISYYRDLEEDDYYEE